MDLYDLLLDFRYILSFSDFKSRIRINSSFIFSLSVSKEKSINTPPNDSVRLYLFGLDIIQTKVFQIYLARVAIIFYRFIKIGCYRCLTVLYLLLLTIISYICCGCCCCLYTMSMNWVSVNERVSVFSLSVGESEWVCVLDWVNSKIKIKF